MSAYFATCPSSARSRKTLLIAASYNATAASLPFAYDGLPAAYPAVVIFIGDPTCTAAAPWPSPLPATKPTWSTFPPLEVNLSSTECAPGARPAYRLAIGTYVVVPGP